MATADLILEGKGFINWIKAYIAMCLAKHGLETFVQEDLNQFIKDLLYSEHGVKAGLICTSCTTANIVHCKTKGFCSTTVHCKVHDKTDPKRKQIVYCPKEICHHIRDAIRKTHTFSCPTWANTDATKWCTSWIEIAKCYTASGYKDKSDLDLNAIISVIVNKKGFESKMKALTKSKEEEDENICRKMLELGNKIRHSPKLNVSETDLNAYINGLVDILSDDKCLAHDQNALKAVAELKELNSDNFVIRKEHDDALNDAMKDLKSNKENLSDVNTPAKESTNGYDEERKRKKAQICNEIKIELADKGSISISHLDTFLEARLTALEMEMTKAKDKHLSEFRKATEEILYERECSRTHSFVDNVSKVFRDSKGLQKDLVTFYKCRYSTMSISPMVTEHDVPLIDLYVQPILEYVQATNILEGAPADLKIHSYYDLFFCEGCSYKEIYVTAKAGIGKTSFAKRICMAWCQAHFPSNHMKNSFSVKDKDAMKKFDYLFMIPLKETKAEECNIDAMIFHLVENQMKSKGRYSVSFIHELLLKRRVLVILDGLDEWVHPKQCQQKTEVIPHRLPCSNCSVITTTRPWKLASAKLSNSQINMHAELHELDQIGSNKLVSSAVKLLNQRYKKSKSAADFQKEVPSELLGALRFIPYVLLQVICLWYDNLSIGNSQCAIYSNVLELTLSRGNHTKGKEKAKTKTLPACLSMNARCQNLYTMLIDLGKLAYEAFFSGSRESTLLFDEDIVKQCLSEDDLQYILKIGLLSQNKDSSKVASWKTYFTFQHKSIQEYFAALYIHAYPENEIIPDKIRGVHTTIESVLEMSNIFIFLGGFNPDVFRRIIQKLKTIISSDAMCCQYRNYLSGRTSLPENRKCWKVVKSFQSMQIDILQEASRNGSGRCHLYIEDLVLDESLENERLEQLVVIVQDNKNNLKSLSIEQSPSQADVTRKLEKFELQNSKDLQKLDVTAVPSEDGLRCLLSNSEQTVVSLDVCFAIFRNNRYKTEFTKLSTKTVETFLRMGNLQSVRLNSIILEHGDLEKLVNYINRKKQMREVGLCHIICSTHVLQCVTLDLSDHENLETLRIGNIPVLLTLNASSLKFCYTGELSDDVHVMISQRLPQAVNMKTLRLKKLTGDQLELYIQNTLAKMAQLKSFSIEYAKIVDIELNFTIPPEMSNLERIHLYQVTIEASVLEQFIKSVDNLHQSVLVIIADCIIMSSSKSYEDVKKRVRKKQRVLFDKGKTFSFITRKQ